MMDDRIYEAIRQGVADAMWQMMTNATDMPCADFYAAIQAGVRDGVRDATAVIDGDD